MPRTCRSRAPRWTPAPGSPIAADAAFSLSTSVPAGTENGNASTGTRQVCDAAGNCATAGAIAGNKVDRKAPALSLPAGKTVDATSPAGTSVTFAATASDGADPAPAVRCTPASGSVFAIGTTTVACTATDHVGNATSGSFTVTVRGAKEQLARLVAGRDRSVDRCPRRSRRSCSRRSSRSLAGFDPSNPAQKKAACTGLSAFATVVRLLSGHGIPPAQADGLDRRRQPDPSSARLLRRHDAAAANGRRRRVGARRELASRHRVPPDRRLPPYVFAEIDKVKVELRRAGEDVIDLGFGNPDIPSPEVAVEKLREAALNPRNHRYSASRGIPRLRRAVCDLYRERWGVELDPETQVTTTIGAKEGLSHLMWVLLGPGDSALVPSPSYPIHIYAPDLRRRERRAGADGAGARPLRRARRHVRAHAAAAARRHPLVPAQPDDRGRRARVHAARRRLRARAGARARPRLRLRRPRLRRPRAALDPPGRGRGRGRGRALLADEVLLDGGVARRLPRRQPRPSSAR